MLTRSFNKKNLNDLPVEILIHILTFIDTFEWNNCKKISRLWRRILEEKFVKRKFKNRPLLRNKQIDIYSVKKSYRDIIIFDTLSNNFAHYNYEKLFVKVYIDFPYRTKTKKFYLDNKYVNFLNIKNDKVYIVYENKIIVWNYLKLSFTEIFINLKNINSLTISNNNNIICCYYWRKIDLFTISTDEKRLNYRKKLIFNEDIYCYSNGKKDDIYVLCENGYLKIIKNKCEKFKVFDDFEEGDLSVNKNSYLCVTNLKIIKIFDDNNTLINTFELNNFDISCIIFTDKIYIHDYFNDILKIFNIEGKLLLDHYFEDYTYNIIRGPFDNIIVRSNNKFRKYKYSLI